MGLQVLRSGGCHLLLLVRGRRLHSAEKPDLSSRGSQDSTLLQVSEFVREVSAGVERDSCVSIIATAAWPGPPSEPVVSRRFTGLEVIPPFRVPMQFEACFLGMFLVSTVGALHPVRGSSGLGVAGFPTIQR
jgi:hypothetical protein